MINLNEVVQYLKRNYPNLKAEIVTAAKNGGECTGISVTFRENVSAIYYPNSYETVLIIAVGRMRVVMVGPGAQDKCAGTLPVGWDAKIGYHRGNVRLILETLDVIF